jgi:hypothetical protein
MTSQPFLASGLPQRPAALAILLLTPKEASKLLKVSLSWLAKARMRGDGPRTSGSVVPFVMPKRRCCSG